MKAIVLCAGYGTRLGESTRTLPKPMLDLNGQPLLSYILKHLSRHGFSEIAINLHFQPDLIRRHFGDGSRFGLRLTWSYEPTLLGTAGAVKNLAAFCQDEPEFLVHYGDVLTDQDFTALVRFHRSRPAHATLLLHRRSHSNSRVELDPDQRIIRFVERPAGAQSAPTAGAWVNSGIHLCSPRLLEAIPAGQACDFPRDIFSPAVHTGRFYGFPLSGYRCAIDSPERYAEAKQALSEGRCQP